MWTKYSSAPCTESPETIQIVSGTVLERLFYRALDAKGNIIFCIKSSLVLNKYLEFSLECACCMRHVYMYIYIYIYIYINEKAQSQMASVWNPEWCGHQKIFRIRRFTKKVLELVMIMILIHVFSGFLICMCMCAYTCIRIYMYVNNLYSRNSR